MGRKQEGSEGLGAGAVFFFLAVLVWLVVTYPWLLLFPVAFWLCFVRPRRPEKVGRRTPPQKVSPARAPRAMVANPPLRTVTGVQPPKPIPRRVNAAPPDFMPKDREYNRFLANTWDEEFEALVKKHEQ